MIMRGKKIIVGVAFAALAATLGGAVPRFSAAIEAGGGYGEIGGGFGRAAASSALEALGADSALRLSGSGEAAYAADGVATGMGSARIEFSAGSGGFVALASLEGGGYRSRTDAGALAGAGLLFTVNGSSASIELAPRVRYDSGASGYLEWGGRLAASVAAGELLIKPSCDIAWEIAADGSSSLAITPSIGSSWYPGLPLAVTMGAGYKRITASDGIVTEALPAFASFYGAVGSRIAMRLEASLEASLADFSLFSATVEGEVALTLGRCSLGEIALPLGVSWSLDATTGFSLGAGLRLSLN